MTSVWARQHLLLVFSLFTCRTRPAQHAIQCKAAQQITLYKGLDMMSAHPKLHSCGCRCWQSTGCQSGWRWRRSLALSRCQRGRTPLSTSAHARVAVEQMPSWRRLARLAPCGSPLTPFAWEVALIILHMVKCPAGNCVVSQWQQPVSPFSICTLSIGVDVVSMAGGPVYNACRSALRRRRVLSAN